MTGSVTHIFNVAASSFVVRDMTLRSVSQHAIQLQPGVDAVVIQNLHILDTGEQMIKIAYDPLDLSSTSDNGIVDNCLLEYSAGIGPQWYIGGIDAHNSRNWIVRHNTFRGIRSPGANVAEHAIHFWSGADNTLVERNTIINCDRGIGFGLGDRGHNGGTIRNNMIYHDSSEGFADVGIALETAVNTRVVNNTIFQQHSYPNAIEYRFGATTGVMIANNLTNRRITQRDGASATVSSNVTTAEMSWFVDTSTGDLHLNSPNPAVVDRGLAVTGLDSDFDGDPRPIGAGIDIGADEYRSGPAHPAPDVRANGSDGPVSVGTADTLSVTIGLDPGILAESSADWWIAADTASGWFYFDYDSQAWDVGLSVSRQAILNALPSLEILNISGLPPGTYTFYFGVDLIVDGQVSAEQIHYDGVVVTVAD